MVDLIGLRQLFDEREQRTAELDELIDENLAVIAKYTKAQKEITRLTKMINQRTVADAETIKKEDWQEDVISNGKYDVFKKDGVAILRKPTTTRTIVPTTFIELHPLLTNDLVEKGKIKIPLNAVEGTLSEDELEEVIMRETRYSFEARLSKTTTPKTFAKTTQKIKIEKLDVEHKRDIKEKQINTKRTQKKQ
jgi:hypothetical protein